MYLAVVKDFDNNYVSTVPFNTEEEAIAFLERLNSQMPDSRYRIHDPEFCHVQKADTPEELVEYLLGEYHTFKEE